MTEQNLQDILQRIRKLEPKQTPIVIAIDGRCGAGKTTIASALSKEMHATIFHMDDFFLRPEQRTAERYSTPGENIDHERFLREVLLPLKEGRTVTYSPFSCDTQTLLSPVTVEATDIVIVEGSYALHPKLREYYDLRVYLTLFPAEQKRRILARNGEAIWPMFRDRWIPMEEAYFRFCGVEENVDLLLWSDS